jgi:DNA-binding SARP family transcriptional activator
VIAALASALDLPPGTIEGLGSLPLVRRVPTGEVSAHPVPGDPEEPSGVVVDERWTETTASVLSPDAKRAVFRALSQVFLERAELGDAGRMAVAAGDVEALERVVRAALGTQPPRIGLTHLDAWAAVEGLGAGTMAWLEGTAASLRNPISERGAMLFEQARSSFAAAGDLDGEVGVISAAGLHARRRDDIDTIASLLGRIGELGPDADPRLGAFAALANAVMTQMAGRHEDAVAALDDLSMAALDVAWRAQVEMVRATNLMILGRFDEAIAGLERATGTGSAWTRSVAHDLLSLARWVAGDRTGALRDAARSCSLATGREVPGLVSVCEAWRRCLEVLDGADPASSLPPDELGEVSGESARLRTAAAALSLVGLGDDDRAATVLASMRDLPNRAVRSTTLVAALETALDLPRSAHWRALAETDRGLRAAVAAGLAAASHRAGGPPPPPTARPYLPPVWWGPQSQRVNVTLIGSPRVAVGSRQLDAQQLSRGKVRELLLHLVLVPSSSRGRRAEEIWPDLPPARAASNLRVTLTQLLDALHPDRPRGSGTDLLDDTRGRLDLVLGPRLYVDLAELRDEAARCVRLLRGGEREGALAAARCLLDLVEGEVLIDDAAVGSWIEQPRRSLEDLVLRAVTEVGAEAVAAGDHDLAERIGLVALALDPWSEAAGRIVVQARLQRGDPDGARRALTDLVRKLDELGLPPLPDTRTLIARLGVTAAAPRSV